MFITSFEEQNITYSSCSNFRIHLYCWNEELVKHLVENSHSKLNLPEPVSEIELPAKYIRFLATQKQGALHIGYTASTTARYKRDLARDYGLMV